MFIISPELDFLSVHKMCPLVFTVTLALYLQHLCNLEFSPGYESCSAKDKGVSNLLSLWGTCYPPDRGFHPDGVLLYSQLVTGPKRSGNYSDAT